MNTPESPHLQPKEQLQNIEREELALKNSELQKENEARGAELAQAQEILMAHVGEAMKMIQEEIQQKGANDPAVQELLGKFAEVTESLQPEARNFFQKNKMSQILRRPPEEILGAMSTLDFIDAAKSKAEHLPSNSTWYLVNFPTNLAEDKIGLGDCLSPEFGYVLLWPQGSGEPTVGVRALTEFPPHRARVGYEDSNGRYLQILDGDHFQAFKTLPKLKEFQSILHFDQEKAQASSPEFQLSKEEEATLAAKELPDMQTEKTMKEQYAVGEEQDEKAEQEFTNTFILTLKGKSPEEAKGYLQSLTPQEVWLMRRTFGQNAVPFRKILIDAGIYDETLPQSQLEQFVETAAQKFPIFEDQKADIKVIRAVVGQESTQKIFAVSDTGALGIAQMTRGNYLRWNFNPFNPEQSILHLAQLFSENNKTITRAIEKYKDSYPGDWEELRKNLVTSAYNNGAGAILEAVRSAAEEGNIDNWAQKLKRQEGREYLGKVGRGLEREKFTRLKKELFGSTAEEVESQLIPVSLFGHEIKVHRLIADKIRNVDAKVKNWRPQQEGEEGVQSFMWRTVRGYEGRSDAYLSNHSFGIALDIDPKYNPLGQKSSTLPDEVVLAFKEEGFDFGLDWIGRKDPMHFELGENAILELVRSQGIEI